MQVSAPPSTTPTWHVPARQPEREARLQRELGVSSLLAAVLVQRGLIEPEEAHAFLNPSYDQFHDPRKLPDFVPAVKAILGAKERGELIFVHGDYDVDGVTSAALYHRFLRSVGCRVVTHVPHRMKEGYGIHESAVEAAREAGAKLFLTCDCGTGAHEQIRAAHAAGMTVVVTDHHEVGETLPEAAAVINPHRADSTYPFPELAGVGVAFKFAEGIAAELGLKREHFYRAFLDLAALGTIADVMPLVGENRLLARFGLEQLGITKKIGLQALMREAELQAPLRSYHVGFVLGPRLNAAGRIDDAALALDLLIESDPTQAAAMAREIERINQARREEQERTIQEAEALVLEQGMETRRVIVIAREGWHSGIIGIVAGRLVERFRRPTFVLAIDPAEGLCKGSARTIPKFHLADALNAHRDLLLSGGGHAMAAGCSLPLDRLEAFRDGLHGYAADYLTDEDFLPHVEADVLVEGSEVTLNALEELQRMEPFGCANPTPSFMVRGAQIGKITPTRKPEHVQLEIQAGETLAKGMGFSMGDRLTPEMEGITCDLLFQPTLDEWRGRRSVKWHVRDFLPQTSP